MVVLGGAVVLALYSLAAACLITNCPKGGKRGPASPQNFHPPDRSCMLCGPELLGRCLGPAICCGPRQGCLVGAPGVLQQCERAETLYPPPGHPCLSPSGLGVCASLGVCCDSESCRIDLSCDEEHLAEMCSRDDVTFGSDF